MGWQALAFAASALPRDVIPTVDHVKLPDWPFHIDHQSGFTGIIVGSRVPNKFYLYNKDFEPVFALESSPDAPFQSVRMAGYESFLILSERMNEGIYNFHVLNLDGTSRFSLLRLGSQLESSPSGSFFYAKKDFIYGGGAPVVYGPDGQELAAFSACEFWELTAANDSVLMFLNGYSVTTLAIPSMAVLRQRSFDSSVVGPALPVPRIAISRSGTKVAVSAVEQVAILDLESGQTGMAPYPTTDGLMDIVLSPDGNLLLEFFESGAGPTIYALHGVGAAMNLVGQAITAPFDTPVEYMVRRPLIMGNVCLSNYSFSTGAGLGFRSLLLPFDETGVPKATVRAISGYSTSAASNREAAVSTLIVHESPGTRIARREFDLLDD